MAAPGTTTPGTPTRRTTTSTRPTTPSGERARSCRGLVDPLCKDFPIARRRSAIAPLGDPHGPVRRLAAAAARRPPSHGCRARRPASCLRAQQPGACGGPRRALHVGGLRRHARAAQLARSAHFRPAPGGNQPATRRCRHPARHAQRRGTLARGDGELQLGRRGDRAPRTAGRAGAVSRPPDFVRPARREPRRATAARSRRPLLVATAATAAGQAAQSLRQTLARVEMRTIGKRELEAGRSYQ